MKRNVGLWIDHRETFLVLSETTEKKQAIESGMEKHVRFLVAIDQQKRLGRRPARTGIHGLTLNRYYDEVNLGMFVTQSPPLFARARPRRTGKRLASKGLVDHRRVIQLTR